MSLAVRHKQALFLYPDRQNLKRCYAHKTSSYHSSSASIVGMCERKAVVRLREDAEAQLTLAVARFDTTTRISQQALASSNDKSLEQSELAPWRKGRLRYRYIRLDTTTKTTRVEVDTL